MERTFGDNWRNTAVGLVCTILIVGGGLAAAFW
jgi:hypothetical protein